MWQSQCRKHWNRSNVAKLNVFQFNIERATDIVPSSFMTKRTDKASFTIQRLYHLTIALNFQLFKIWTRLAFRSPLNEKLNEPGFTLMRVLLNKSSFMTSSSSSIKIRLGSGDLNRAKTLGSKAENDNNRKIIPMILISKWTPNLFCNSCPVVRRWVF